MITRKDEIKEDVRGGYRTVISDGENHFIIDTCYTFDRGNESMVFETRENSLEDKYINWKDLDSRGSFTIEEMETVHNEMVQKWIEKLERE